MSARRNAVVRAAGIAGGVLVAAAVTTALAGELGRGPMLVPLTFGFIVVTAVVAGETFVKPPAGPRTASLTPRRVVDYLPGRLTSVVAVLLLLLAGTLLLTTLTASEDGSLGGRRVIACATEVVSSAVGPYAGSYYTGRLALVLAALLAVAALAARQVVLRPRGVAAFGEDDDVLRRSSMNAIVLAVGTALGATQAGIGAVSGAALLRLDLCAPAWAAPVGWGLVLSAVAAAGVATWCLVRLLRPATVPAGARRS